MCDLQLPLGTTADPALPGAGRRDARSHGSRRSASAASSGATATPTAELQKRLEYELGVITSMGYAGYFLIVADFIRFAREQGIQTTCRGSAPGSIVTYTLGITPGRPDRLRPAVRALPQPRPGDDAGHRRRLPGRPTRRGHRLRLAQVRPGPRRPDHHLRHDARPRGDPRRRAACSATRYGDVDRVAKAVPNQLGIRLEEALETRAAAARAVRRGPGRQAADRLRQAARGRRPQRVHARRRASSSPASP